MKKLDVLMCGVGGQGIVLASDALAEVAMLSGYDVKKSDALGMAQRGGSVVSHVRLGEQVFSPMIKKGDADIVLAFEKLEAARWSPFVAEGGTVIVNNQAILPLSVSGGSEVYPSDEVIAGIVKLRTNRIFNVEGRALAEKLGNIRVLNIVMLGFLSVFLPINVRIWEEALPRFVPCKFLDLNLQAFSKGREQAEKMGAASLLGV